jgi:hypothetical protein
MSSSSARKASRESARSSATARGATLLVQLADDRVADGLDVLLVMIELLLLGCLVRFEPVDDLNQRDIT